MHDRQEKVYRIHFSSSSCWPSSVLPFSLPFFPSSSSFPSRDPYLPPVTPDDGMQTQTPSECACEAIMIFDLHRDFDSSLWLQKSRRSGRLFPISASPSSLLFSSSRMPAKHIVYTGGEATGSCERGCPFVAPAAAVVVLACKSCSRISPDHGIVMMIPSLSLSLSFTVRQWTRRSASDGISGSSADHQTRRRTGKGSPGPDLLTPDRL